MNISYWERSVFLAPRDFVVIGGGIVGLSAAITLALRVPKARVCVVERGVLPSGATTKSAGFACFGSIGELLELEDRYGRDTVIALVLARYRGLKALLRLVDPGSIEYVECGNYEAFSADQSDLEQHCADNIGRYNQLLAGALGVQSVYCMRRDDIALNGLSAVRNLIFNRAEGALNSAKLVVALARRAQELGVQIFNGFEIDEIQQSGHGYLLQGRAGLDLRAQRVLVATNAFSAQILPDLTSELKAARSQVLVTAPIAGLKLRGCFHLDRGYTYFREVDGRVLLGGARNLDFDGEATSEFGLSTVIQQRLERILREMILPHQHVEIEQRWSGIMCFGPQLEPIVREVRPNLFCAIRMSGMGIAIGSTVGEQVADLALQS